MKKTYLMADRYWIANHHNEAIATGSFRFRINPPKKPGKPFLVADKPWESMSLGWGTMLFDKGIYRLWYEAFDQNYRDDFDGRLCYAESPDGIFWSKPSLGLVEYEGSRENNIIFDGTMSGGMGFHGHSIFIDPMAEASARYKMTFLGGFRPYFSGCGNPVHLMSFACSPDGIRWKWGHPAEQSWLLPPVTSFGSDTQSVVFWDNRIRKYVGYFRKWDGNIRIIGRSETTDLTDWKRPESILFPDDKDPFGSDFYNSAASVYSSGDDTVYFMFISLFNHRTDKLDVRLAVSRDGINYTRPDRDAYLANGDEFDSGSIYMCPGISKSGDKLTMCYIGVSHRHGEAVPEKISYSGGFGMLEIDKDRFQGLDTDDSFEFSLKGFDYTGGNLNIEINAIIRSGGYIKGGLVKEGTVEYLEGFSPEDCIPLTEDGMQMKLSWKNGAEPCKGISGRLELRLHLEKCILFSVSVEC